MADYPSGIALPFRFGTSGGVVGASGVDKLRTNLKAVVYTALQERLIRKTVGAIGYRQVFRNTGEADVSWLAGLVKSAIAKNEKRVVVKRVALKKVDKELYIDVQAVSKSSGDPVDVLVQL